MFESISGYSCPTDSADWNCLFADGESWKKSNWEGEAPYVLHACLHFSDVQVTFSFPVPWWLSIGHLRVVFCVCVKIKRVFERNHSYENLFGLLQKQAGNFSFNLYQRSLGLERKERNVAWQRWSNALLVTCRQHSIKCSHPSIFSYFYSTVERADKFAS